jgi:hypothetical protein
MDETSGEDLESVRRGLGVDLADVWLAYFGLGGTATPAVIEGYLRGADTLDRLQHDILAQAINEHAMDKGMDHPAPYAEDRVR